MHSRTLNTERLPAWKVESHISSLLLLLVVCPRGYMRDADSGECVVCPKGTYNTTVDGNSCTSFPEGQTTPREGTNEDSHCHGIYLSN